MVRVVRHSAGSGVHLGSVCEFKLAIAVRSGLRVIHNERFHTGDGLARIQRVQCRRALYVRNGGVFFSYLPHPSGTLQQRMNAEQFSHLSTDTGFQPVFP